MIIIVGLLIKNDPEHYIYVKEMTFCAFIIIATTAIVVQKNIQSKRKIKLERKRLLADFADKYGYIEEYVQLPNTQSVFQLPLFTEKGFKDVVGCITIENEVCAISVFDYMYALKKNFYNVYFYSFFYIESKSIKIPSFTLLPMSSKKSDWYENEPVKINHSSFNKHFALQSTQPHVIEKWFNSQIISFLLRDKGIYMQTTPKGLLVWRTYLQYDEEEIMEFILRYVYFFNLLLEALQKVGQFEPCSTT
ncbi:MAG: hypothetical protein NZ455_02000 [Bacteroidia bacterium]|nr:hypothetical protein [Bacteroidia bacterium]MDW8346542.1 hypothetical protein [Bacteroidia bacterium]